MKCKACGNRPVARGKKQIKVPHPSGKPNHYEIRHEDEDMCSVCIGYSENSYYEEDISVLEDLDFIPKTTIHYEDL